MQLCHRISRASARFDDPNLVSVAGLVPVLGLAERAGLRRLADGLLTVPGDKGAHAGSKVAALVAGMVAGADSIEDMHLLRHGGMERVFTGLYAPSTLGSFLRSFAFGHVRQLDAVAARLLASLAAQTPLLPGAGQIAYLDVDDTIRATYGYAKQGAGYGYSGVKGLNALLGALSTPSAAPVIVATRLRKGSANSARGAKRLVADALRTSRACGASGLLVVRADSAFYGSDVVAAIRRAKARFSITARQDVAVRRAIAAIGEDAWTTIRYPRAVFDEQLGQWVSDAQIAEVPFTAFASRGKKHAVTARLIVRRVRDANPDHVHVTAKASCSRSGATTPCSPTRRWSSSRLRPTTAVTRSSSRSSPTSRTARSRTCPPAGSTPTVPGSPWPPWRSTSPALPARSPRGDTPKPPRRPSARN